MRTVQVSLFLFLFACCTLLAQTVSGQISGTVKDASGAVLPGVEIKVTQTDTAATRTVVSNETGSYWNFDAALWRTFPLREKLKMDFPPGSIQSVQSHAAEQSQHNDQQ